MKSKILTRIVFGSIMIAVLAGLLYLDWWLEARYERQTREAQARQWAPFLSTYPDAQQTPPSRYQRYQYAVLGMFYGRPRWEVKLPTAVVLAGLLAMGFFELRRLAKATGAGLLPVSGLAAILLLATMNYWGPHLLLRCSFDMPWLRMLSSRILILLAAAVGGAFLEQMIRHRVENALRNVAATMLAVLYLGLCGAFIFDIRLFGVEYLVLFLAAVKCTDIGAYFTGTAIGKHKLIPWLSPGKTWEGLVGGLLTAGSVSILLWRAMGIEELMAWQAGVFGVVVGLVGQFGDLCESLLKRSADTKDSGALVPQFGGVLDMIDSPLLAAPAAMAMLAMMLD